MIIVMRGIPGAGKTTWAKNTFPNGHIVSADDYHSRMGTYSYDKEQSQEAHNWCVRSFIDLARLNRMEVVIVDNTNIFAVDIAPYISIGRAYGHPHKIVTILAQENMAHERNTHSVSLEKINQLAEYLQKEHLPSFWAQEVVAAWAPPGTSPDAG